MFKSNDARAKAIEEMETEEEKSARITKAITTFSMQKMNDIVLSNGKSIAYYLSEDTLQAFLENITDRAREGIKSIELEKMTGEMIHEWMGANFVKYSMQNLDSLTITNGQPIGRYVSEKQMRSFFEDVWEAYYCIVRVEYRDIQMPCSSSYLRSSSSLYTPQAEATKSKEPASASSSSGSQGQQNEAEYRGWCSIL